jgi:hypothetical protein
MLRTSIFGNKCIILRTGRPSATVRPSNISPTMAPHLPIQQASNSSRRWLKIITRGTTIDLVFGTLGTQIEIIIIIISTSYGVPHPYYFLEQDLI